jgi:hypothetical protein
MSDPSDADAISVTVVQQFTLLYLPLMGTISFFINNTKRNQNSKTQYHPSWLWEEY